MIEKLKEKLGDLIKDIKIHNERRIYITVDKKDLKEAAKIVFKDMGGRYVVVTGVDNFDKFELLYHFSFDKEGGVVTSLRVFLDKGSQDIITEELRNFQKAGTGSKLLFLLREFVEFAQLHIQLLTVMLLKTCSG